MKKFPMYAMSAMHTSASAACADAASACAHTAASRSASAILDALLVASIIISVLGNCVLAVLGVQGLVLAVLLVWGNKNPSEASLFA